MNALSSYPWLEEGWRGFLRQIEEDRLGHAVLITGQRGLGKAELSQAMVSLLLCLNPDGEACGECRSCLLARGGAHPDRFLLGPEEDKSVITVTQVRQLISQLMLTSTISRYKVALIAPAEAMSLSAANALLKTLEEPPGDTVILLLSHDPSRLPVTIRSRCQTITIRSPDTDRAIKWLAEHIAETGSERLKQALQAAGGSPKMAQHWLREGWVDQLNKLREELRQLIGKPSRLVTSTMVVSEVDKEVLWDWLSQSAALALKESMHATPPQWLNGADRLPARRLSLLQAKADRNRRLEGSGVRGDLLLQEWLLEWARLPAREELD